MLLQYMGFPRCKALSSVPRARFSVAGRWTNCDCLCPKQNPAAKWHALQSPYSHAMTSPNFHHPGKMSPPCCLDVRHRFQAVLQRHQAVDERGGNLRARPQRPPCSRARDAPLDSTPRAQAQRDRMPPRQPLRRGDLCGEPSTFAANLRTNIMDFRRFDSSRN